MLSFSLCFNLCSAFVSSLQLHTDPLLVDVGQEEAVLLVQVVVQGVVPVLRLHQADNHKHNESMSLISSTRSALCSTQQQQGCIGE